MQSNCKLRIGNIIILLTVALILVGILVVGSKNVEAKTIYVDDDGGADFENIQDAVNAAEDGDTVYVFAGDYIKPVVVNKTINLTGESKNNVIIVDTGAGDVVVITADSVNISGFMINGIGDYNWYAGICVISNNNKIFNNTISKLYWGIELVNSENNTIFNNNLSWNRFGIELWDDSYNNTISNNSYSQNSYGIKVCYGSNKNKFSNNICSYNLDIGMEIHSEDNIISNNICSNNNIGISFPFHNIVFNNTCSNNYNSGIWIFNSKNNTVFNNNCSNNKYGIYSEQSSNNTFSNNTYSNNKYGIYLEHSSNNTFTNNTCSKNQKGIYLNYSNNNTFTRNQIINSTNFGAEIKNNCSNNTFYHNTFIDNNNCSNIYNSSRIQAKDSGNNNSWYNKTLGEGNHWSDWIKPDENKDGIVDEPYLINGSAGSKDLYPFVYSFEDLIKGIAYIDSISPNPALFGENIYFKGHGITFDTNIKRYVWQSDIYGEFYNSTESSISFSKLSKGEHNITFKLMTDFGFWSNPVFENLIIHVRPIGYIDKIFPNSAIEGEKVEFKGHGTDDGTITQYLWESNIDGFLSNKESFELLNLSIGTHTITFKVKDNYGIWSDLVTQKLEVKKKEEIPEKPELTPKLKVSKTKIKVGETITLDASESIGDVFAYFFDFGDETNSGWVFNSSINHNYSKTGKYIIKLKIRDVNGVESDYDSLEIIVEEIEKKEKKGEMPWLELILIIFIIILLISAFWINRKSKTKALQKQLSQQQYPQQAPSKIESKIDDEFLKI